MAWDVFVDASFFTALFYPRDEHHVSAQNTWREIHSLNWPTVTTNWTLYEVLTFLNSNNRRRHDLAVKAIEFVASSTQIVHVEATQLEDRNLDIFRLHSDKLWSVVDCANFACIELRQSDYALSYDRNFEQAQAEFGFQLLKP